MRVTVLLFAGVAERAGRRRWEVELPPGSRAGDALQALVASYPAVAPLADRLLLARNQEYVTADAPLAEGDELAFIPPVSGGSAGQEGREGAAAAELAEGPLDPLPLLDAVGGPTIGAVLLFAGVAREITGERRTTLLEYEAYRPMALATMQEIVEEVVARWPGTRIRMVHRLGRLEMGEASVLIAVGAPHRDQAYQASRHAIERLKAVVPIWKREHYAGGEARWVGE